MKRPPAAGKAIALWIRQSLAALHRDYSKCLIEARKAIKRKVRARQVA
jgi:hypothetical protein